MTFSPNLKVLSDWRSSLTVAFSTLRRIAFIVLDDFSFGDFNPNTNFSTMTATAYVCNRARYVKIGKFMFFSIDIQATLAAVFTSAVRITLPYTVAGESTSFQGVAGFGQNGGTGEACVAQVAGGASDMFIYRYNNANYTAGAWRARINGFMETM